MMTQKNNATGSPHETKNASKTPDIIVCMGKEESAPDSIGHALLIAKALKGNVLLLQTIEPPKHSKIPHDPVEWELQKREAKAQLSSLAKNIGDNSHTVKTALREGPIVEQARLCISQRPQDIITVFRAPSKVGWQVADIGRSIIESDVGSVLMVPTDLEDKVPKAYERIIVPLDGSPRAETAIPKAVRLAKAQNAKIILCHVTPAPVISHIRYADVEAKNLSKKVDSSNLRIGQQYLSGLNARLAGCGVEVSTCIAGNGDVRRSLLKLVKDQGADIIVLASHGQSNHPDVPAGDIANFVMGRSPIPVLMVRQSAKIKAHHAYSNVKSKGVRLANAAVQ